nr:hypothetical protein [uncultured Flavobacterium sp.]
MQILKIYATILDKTAFGSGANCQVYCIEFEKNRIYDITEIKKHLSGNDTVFSTKIFSNANQLLIGNLVEIPVINISFESKASKNPYVTHENVKKIGYRIIDIPIEMTDDVEYIDCEKVTEYIKLHTDIRDSIGKFFLSDSQSVYGPFKFENNFTVPYLGKSIIKYDFNFDEIIDVQNQQSYILNEPKSKIAELDCMSKTQILEYLKKILKLHKDVNIDINKIKEISDAILKVNEGQDYLDRIRLKRASNYLNTLILSYEELNDLKNQREDWENLINQNYSFHKEKFEADIFQKLEFKITQKENELSELNFSLESGEQLLAKQKKDLESLKEEIKNIEIKKNDLILSIQIAAGVNQFSHKNNFFNEKTFYYLEENYSELLKFKDCEDYLEDLYSKKVIGKTQKKYFSEGLFWIKKSNFLLANNSSYVIALVKSLGNYKIIVQNAEIDWVKYENLYVNGFSSIIESAVKYPNIYHFYLLQDFNIASPECYAKPVIDISHGLNINVPGTKFLWPKNLFFVGVPVDAKIIDFGFNLNASTFDNWRGLPQIDELFDSSNFLPSNKIDLNLVNISLDYEDNIENYIS